MKVLMLSIDEKILDPTSPVAGRMRDYGTLVEKLDIVVYTRSGFSVTEISATVTAYPTNCSPWLYFWTGYGVCERILKEGGQALITSQEAFTNMLAWLLRFQFRNVCFEAQLHTDCFNPYFRSESFKNYLRYLAYRFTIRRADRVRVVSRRLKEGLQGWGVSAEKIYVLPIFVDVEKIKNTLPRFDLHKKYPQFEKIILMVSRLSREKNISLALEALAEVLKTRPKVGLIIVGDGPERARLELQTTDYGLQSNVVFEGWQSDTISYYKTADVFLSTSWYEGYGLTLVEATVAGVLVATTPVGVSRDISAILIPYEPSGVAKIILSVLSGEVSNKGGVDTVTFSSYSDYLKLLKHLWNNA